MKFIELKKQSKVMITLSTATEKKLNETELNAETSPPMK